MKGYGIIGFIFGVGAGGAAGFYVGKKVSEKKTVNELAFKIEQIRGYYDSKFEALKNELTKEKMAEDARTNKEPEGTDAVENEKAENEVTEADIKGNEEIIQKCNYSAFSKKDAEEENKEEIMSNLAGTIALEPEEIDEDEFYDLEYEGYMRRDVILCAIDRTWFDERDVVLNDMDSRIGIENTDMFCESCVENERDEDRWVKNPMTNEIFRISVFYLDSAAYMKGR